jgi:hypothetical protein
MRTIVGKVEDWAAAGAETLVAIADLMISAWMRGERERNSITRSPIKTALGESWNQLRGPGKIRLSGATGFGSPLVLRSHYLVSAVVLASAGV